MEESRFMRHVLECAVVELDCELAGPDELNRTQSMLAGFCPHFKTNACFEVL